MVQQWQGKEKAVLLKLLNIGPLIMRQLWKSSVGLALFLSGSFCGSIAFHLHQSFILSATAREPLRPPPTFVSSQSNAPSGDPVRSAKICEDGSVSESLLVLAKQYQPTKFLGHLHTGYHRFYKDILEPFRCRKFKFLEIGLATGNGTLLWRHFFPRADIHGVEYAATMSSVGLKKAASVAKIHLGDQSSPKFLKYLIEQTGGTFDLIIDDGGHHYIDQVKSYQYLFDAMNPGGTYIIEDIETSYWKGSKLYGPRIHTGGINKPRTTVDKFSKMVHVVNRKFHDNNFRVLGAMDWWVRGVAFYQNVIVLYKKDRSDQIYDAHYWNPRLLCDPAGRQGGQSSFGPSPMPVTPKELLDRSRAESCGNHCILPSAEKYSQQKIFARVGRYYNSIY